MVARDHRLSFVLHAGEHHPGWKLFPKSPNHESAEMRLSQSWNILSLFGIDTSAPSLFVWNRFFYSLVYYYQYSIFYYLNILFIRPPGRPYIRLLCFLHVSPMPPAHLLWLVVSWTFFRSFLLTVVLVRWCPDVVALSHVLQSTVIFGADVVSFQGQNMSLGMLVASNLAPWGTIERFRGLGNTRRETLGSRFGFLSILHGFRDRYSRVFGELWNNKCVFLSCVFAGHVL